MVLHVMPAGDLIAHEPTDLCPCGPRVEPADHGDGTYRWVHVHPSLDGIERDETPGADR